MLLTLFNQYLQELKQVLPLFKRYWITLLLVLCLLLSAHLLIQMTHQSRSQHVRLQALESERDALQVEWGRLLLEESTLVSSARLEPLAREALGLRLPESTNLQIIRVTKP